MKILKELELRMEFASGQSAESFYLNSEAKMPIARFSRGGIVLRAIPTGGEFGS